MPYITFQVCYEPEDADEVVCVTGSIPALGAWSPQGLQPMNKGTTAGKWTCTIEVPDNTAISYRYAVCSNLRSSSLKIHRWETNLSPRQVCVKDANYITENETFGEYGGEFKVQRGWLVDTREIRLMFEKPALNDFKSSLNSSQYYLRVRAMNVTDSAITVPVLVHNLSLEDCSPRLQAEDGESLQTCSDVITFSTQSLPATHEAKLVIQILSGKSTNTSSENLNSPKRLKGENNIVGECAIMSNNLTNSVGTLPLYFFAEAGISLGHVEASYTVIKPLNALELHGFDVSYATHWKRRRKTLNIGHRGMGKSMKDHTIKNVSKEVELVSIPENTIFSLTEAAEHGADFVEFDVHVTKDGHPVLFHDFQFSLCIQEPSSSSRTHITKVPIKDMTLAQLSVVRKLAPVGQGTTDFLCETVTSAQEDALAFGQLRTALETVPVHCGFDIEIKYPMKTASGSEYDGTPMDMNQSVDAILRVVLKYGGKRRIFFSAFNPDVCAMIQLKQCKYPVMLCNFGKTDIFESYTDPRSVSVKRSIVTSRAYQVLGLCGHCEDYIADPALVEECHSNGLALMCWGERTALADIREKLSEVGVDGIIHDRMGTCPRGTRNYFVTEAETK